MVICTVLALHGRRLDNCQTSLDQCPPWGKIKDEFHMKGSNDGVPLALLEYGSQRAERGSRQASFNPRLLDGNFQKSLIWLHSSFLWRRWKDHKPRTSTTVPCPSCRPWLLVLHSNQWEKTHIEQSELLMPHAIQKIRITS